MDGFPVKQAIPTQKVDQVDPFLLIHHGRVKPLRGRPAKAQGVGPHPHRGFSPVTFVVEGEVHHRDSRGNNQIAKNGEVQWMHAGMGIMHSERPSAELVEKHGPQEIVQLWINSPAKNKMDQPSYSYLGTDSSVISRSQDGLIERNLISGEHEGKTGPIPGISPLLIIWAKARAEGKDEFQIPKGYNSSIYLIKGKIRIEGYGLVEKENYVVFEEEGDSVKLEVMEDSEFLLLSGEPLNEKVVKQGPFVMNSETEILEAMRDYQMGKMGILIEDDM